MTNPRLALSYFGNRYPQHARQDLEAIQRTGASIVDHVMSEEDLRWYPGTIESLIGISHDLGLEAWLAPWALGGVFGGEAASYAVMEYPESCQRDSAGNSLPSLCFNQKPFRDLMTNWLDIAAESGADVVTWDEPHIGSPGTPQPGAEFACRCNVCQELFQASTGSSMPVGWNDQIAQFNSSVVSRTLKWLVDEANNRDLESAIIVFPDEEDADSGWKEWASLPGVTYFGASPYWIFQGIEPEGLEDYLRLWCRRITNATEGTDAQSLAWLQAFSIPEGRESENDLGLGIMEDEGIEVIGVWSYRACEAMSALAPVNRQLVWDVIVRAFESIKKS